MKLSVVIPVYNEEKHIKSCVQSLLNGKRVPDEILIVDGGSTDNTIKILKSFPQIKILKNKKKNAAAGRNLGIAHATGEVIAFIDGDCYADRLWLSSIENFFKKNDADGIGGRIKNARPCNKYEAYWGKLAWELIMSFGDERYQITKKTINDTIVTANAAYKADLLKKMKGFDEWFANNAEDTDLCWRCVNKKAKLFYIPEAVVYAHNVDTLRGIARKSFRNGFSSSKLQKRYGSGFNFDPNIYKMLGQNILRLVLRKENAELNLVELCSHLAGKYYGSLKVGIINI